MYRVVTKAMVFQKGVRTRQIDNGPWQPAEAVAQHWADFLRATGCYDSVVVQSNGQQAPEQASSMGLYDEDLAL